MAESLVELVKRVAAEYEATKLGGEISEISEKSPPRSPLSSHISLISQRRAAQWDQGDLGPSYLRDRYEERAATQQFDAGKDRARAEARAWHEVAAIWHRQHGERSPRGICAGCGHPLGGTEIITLPRGDRVHAGAGNRAFQCLGMYSQRWKAAAAIALANMGIPAPKEEDEAVP